MSVRLLRLYPLYALGLGFGCLYVVGMLAHEGSAIDLGPVG
jgi:hypothetical protein